MKSIIGDFVHYEGQGKTYPALVVAVKEDGILHLCVFKETSTQFLPVVYHSENKEPGYWTHIKKPVQHFSVPIDKSFGAPEVKPVQAQLKVKAKAKPKKKK